jgi:hypothetical protein
VRALDDPYAPGAGTVPEILAGRDVELEAFALLLDRLKLGRPAKSMIVTGLRGVGKTVLLRAFAGQAIDRDWVAVERELTPETPFAQVVAMLARRALFELSPPARWRAAATRAAGVLRSFQLTVATDGTVSFGVDAEPVAGSADSGVLDEDLTDLLVALGHAAREHERGVVFLLDEVQFLGRPELTALIVALHKLAQERLPVALVGAGLPQLPALAGAARSYSERLFDFPQIAELAPAAAAEALVLPARERGVEFTPGALARCLAYSERYPYFLQVVGSKAWRAAPGSPIDLDDVDAAIPVAEDELDAGFFRVRAERTTALELRYLRAMAELGPGPQRSGEIATKLGYAGSEQIGPTRANLIAKGLIYTPGHGLNAFTVPHFDRYMRRTYPFEPAAPARRTRGRG